MRYQRKHIGRNVLIAIKRDRHEPESESIQCLGMIEHVRRGIATVRYNIPWHFLQEGYVTYLDGTEPYVSLLIPES